MTVCLHTEQKFTYTPSDLIFIETDVYHNEVLLFLGLPIDRCCHLTGARNHNQDTCLVTTPPHHNPAPKSKGKRETHRLR